MKTMFERWKSSYLSLLADNSLSLLFDWVFLGLILIACLIVRLWTIDDSSLDRTLWKEIDYITISSNYWKHGYKFLEPEITWPAELPRITAMELPLGPYGASFLYGIFGYNVLTGSIL